MLDDIKIIHLKSNAQRLETWIAMLNGEVVGHIYMEREENARIKFLDAWVDESHRRKGIYRKLWETRWEYVNENYKGHTVYAWCKDSSLPLLLEKGFNTGEIVTYVEKTI
jgi:predicted GNAT family acetyltransferase